MKIKQTQYMRNYLVLILFVLTLLPSCVPKIRADFNWEQYGQASVKDKIIVSAGIEDAWDSLVGAGKDLELELIVQDKKTGLLSFGKKDDEFDNVILQLSVLASSLSAYESVIKLRGFVYSNRFRAYTFIKVMPSDGTLEKEYMKAVLARLNSHS